MIGLHETTLTIQNGIFALLGPNGAGKSTLMSIIATLLEPTRGTVRVDGHDVLREKHEVRRILGYLPQDFGLYPSLTTYELLDYIALLYGMDDSAARKRAIEDTMARVNLTEVRGRPVGQLSGGMKQRVGLAQALLNTPKLLIVDEPTVGLDPEERIRVRSLLAELGGERVILLSTHLIEDVEAVADRVAVLYRGRVRFEGTVDEMRERVRGRMWQVDMLPGERQQYGDKYLETALMREGGRIHIRLVADAAPDGSARAVEPNLEDAYIWLMHEDGHAAH